MICKNLFSFVVYILFLCVSSTVFCSEVTVLDNNATEYTNVQSSSVINANNEPSLPYRNDRDKMRESIEIACNQETISDSSYCSAVLHCAFLNENCIEDMVSAELGEPSLKEKILDFFKTTFGDFFIDNIETTDALLAFAGWPWRDNFVQPVEITTGRVTKLVSSIALIFFGVRTGGVVLLGGRMSGAARFSLNFINRTHLTEATVGAFFKRFIGGGVTKSEIQNIILGVSEEADIVGCLRTCIQSLNHFSRIKALRQLKSEAESLFVESSAVGDVLAADKAQKVLGAVKNMLEDMDTIVEAYILETGTDAAVSEAGYYLGDKLMNLEKKYDSDIQD